MNIHTYIEKRASLRQKYLTKVVDPIVYKIMGKGEKDSIGTYLRVAAGTAANSVLAPIDIARVLKNSPAKLKKMEDPLIKEIKGYESALKEIKDGTSPLKPPNRFGDGPEENLDFYRRQFERDLATAKADLKLFRAQKKKVLSSVIAGAGVGYGALGYGGYKGGQKVKKHLEKNASLRQKYIKGVERISDAIAGADPKQPLSSLRTIPAVAFEAVAAPIQTAKEAISFRREMKDQFRDIDEGISSLTNFQRRLKDGDHSLSPKAAKDLKDEISQSLSEHKGLKSELKAFQRNATIGAGIGYGTLGYGGYKGGQKVKNYIQDKKRGQ